MRSEKTETESRGLQVRLVRRLPVEPARRRGRTAAGGRSGGDRLLPGSVADDAARGRTTSALVEGSITTHHDAERIQQVRRQCEVLVTIGACATAGGIQALRNWSDVKEFVARSTRRRDYIQTLKMSTPIAEHVLVDFELRGCPINKKHLIELISATLAGRKPNVPTLQPLHEVQAPRQRVHHDGARRRRALAR